MIIVNLLPEEARPKVKTPIPYIASLTILGFAVLAMVWMWMASRDALAHQRAQLAQYEGQLNQYGNVVEQYNDLQDQKVALAEKIDIIKEIVKDRLVWSKELWRLSKLTPDNVWYSGINVVNRTATVTVMAYDAKKKKDVEKKERVTLPMLEIKGYVVADKSGKMGISPLMFNLRDVPVPDPDETGEAATEAEVKAAEVTGNEGASAAAQVEENVEESTPVEEKGTKFSKRFRLRDHDWENVEIDGVPALAFTLEFEITTGAEPSYD